MPNQNLTTLATLIGDDSHACSFQSLGQYRAALLKAIAQASAQPASGAVPEVDIERLQLESAYYRATLRNVLKDIRDELVRGGMPESWKGIAETISIVLEVSTHPISGEQKSVTPDCITIERDFMGTMHIKVGDFDYVQVRYQYPYTDNAATSRLAQRIAELISSPPAEHGITAILLDPEAVLVNMLRGTIAIPSVRSWSKLFGDVINDDEKLLLEIARLRVQVQDVAGLVDALKEVRTFFKDMPVGMAGRVESVLAAHRAKQTDHSVAINKMVEGQQ